MLGLFIGGPKESGQQAQESMLFLGLFFIFIFFILMCNKFKKKIIRPGLVFSLDQNFNRSIYNIRGFFLFLLFKAI